MKKAFFVFILFILISGITGGPSRETVFAEETVSEEEPGLFFITDVFDAAYYTPSESEGRIFKGKENGIHLYQLFDKVNYSESGYELVLVKTTGTQKTIRIPLRMESYLFEETSLLVWGKRKVGLLFQYEFHRFNADLVATESLVIQDVGYASFPSMVPLEGKYYFAGNASSDLSTFSAYAQEKTLGQSDAAILILNQNLTWHDVWLYGGVNNERFTVIHHHNDRFVVTGEKSSLGGGDFSNVGQADQEKGMLIEIDENGNITNGLYFNHDKYYEFCFLTVLIDDYAFVNIYAEDNEENFIYKVNLSDFTVVWGIEASEAVETTMNVQRMTKGSESVLIITGSNNFGHPIVAGISVLDGEVIGSKNLMFYYNVNSIKNVEGTIRMMGDEVTFVNNKVVYLAKEIALEQYKVEKNNTKICSRLSCDMEDVSNVTMTTWLGEVSIEDRILPSNFSTTVHGDYPMTYRYRLPSGRTIDQETMIRVVFYANVVEGGLYGLGFKIHFTGIGQLNGTPIQSGKAINSAGNYQLTTLDNQGESTIIAFTIENGIMFSGDNNTIWNIECDKQELLEVRIRIFNPDQLEILAVIIDQTAYPHFTISPDFETITIDILSPDQHGIHLYLIEKIEYDYHGETRSLEIDSLIIINVLKQIPQIQLQEESSGNKHINLKVLFEDDDQAIINIKAILYENDNPIRSKEINLVNGEFSFEQLRTNTSYKATLLVTYNLGNNVRSTIEIARITFFTLKEHISLGSVTITKKGAFLEEAVILLSNTGSQLMLSSVIVDGHELLKPSTIKQDMTLYVAVGAGSVVLTGVAIAIIRHKRKTNMT